MVADAVSRYLAVSEEEPLREPLPLSDEEVTVLRPGWPAIAGELGTRLGFVAADWGSEGVTRQIGIAQHRSELPRPVILHLPAGTFGDQTRLLRDLGRLENAIVLLPSATWISPDVQEIQSRNRLTFITLAEFFDSGESSFPISTAMRSPSKSSTKRHPPVLHPQPGWRWDMVRIEVTTAGRLILSCDGQRKEFTFPKSNRKSVDGVATSGIPFSRWAGWRPGRQGLMGVQWEVWDLLTEFQTLIFRRQFFECFQSIPIPRNSRQSLRQGLRRRTLITAPSSPGRSSRPRRTPPW